MNNFKPSKGIHLIGDFYNCKSNINSLKENELREYISNLISENQLTELGHHYHTFFNNGITCVVALSESHISIHTWPEKNYVTIDIFVCNYSEDNTEKAKKLFSVLVNKFKPEEIKKKEIKR